MSYCILTLLFQNFYCRESRTVGYSKYNLTIKEIDSKTNETVLSFKNVFISSSDGLFEYDFKLQTDQIVDGITVKGVTKEDSVSISFIPAGKSTYSKFDFAGNLIATDLIRNKTTDFIKIDASNNRQDPLFKIMSNVSENDLFDTVINNFNFSTYKYPIIINDSIGDMSLQLFFLRDASLKTPFNINSRYPLVLNRYNLAGFVYTLINANRKFIVLISDIRGLVDAEIALCDGILKGKKY